MADYRIEDDEWGGRTVEIDGLKVRFSPHLFHRIEIAPRRLTGQERRFLEFLLSEPFAGRDELRAQLDAIVVIAETGIANPTIELAVDSAARLPAPVSHTVPVEAEGPPGPQGERLRALLHVWDGYLAKLEFYRDDLAEIATIPDPAALDLITG